LRSKKDQVAVDGHDSYLIGCLRGMPVQVDDVTAACAYLDFTSCPSVDRIYFEAPADEFRLVYDREAWEAMNRGLLPSHSEQRRLVIAWIEVLMSFRSHTRHRRGVELALQISWDQGGNAWLSPGGRELMDFESRLLLQDAEWTAPKAYWEIHRGPLPLEGDGRRCVHPIPVG
jgi:hypothetical protein